MSLKQFAIEMQKRRANGPFKRVRFIDPYPNRLIKAPRSWVATLIILVGLASFVFAPTVLIVGQMGNLKSIDPTWRPYAQILLQGILDLAVHFDLTQLTVAVFLAMVAMAVFASSIFVANFATSHSTLRRWKSKCEKIQASLVDSEIQEREVLVDSSGPNHHVRHTKSRWEYRIQVAFEYGGIRYQATPSVVNRLKPGNLGQDYKTEQECSAALESLGSQITLEIDPQNPLDCDIEKHLEGLFAQSWKAFLYLPLFWVALGAFALLFFKIEQS
jgi:hypothetical protein